MKFRKGDEVKVTGGKDKGKTGKIERVLPLEHKVVITGINMYKRHLKAQDAKRPAGIIDIVKPVPVGRIALLCPKCKQVTRIGFSIDGDKKKRICRKCEQEV